MRKTKLFADITKLSKYFVNKGMTKFLYMILEYDKSYSTLKLNVPHFTFENKLFYLNNIMKTLWLLNKEIGFVHWDLHPDNLLVNIKSNEFKLFDFDLSSTKKNINDEIYSRIGNSLKNYIEAGFLYDIFRLTIGMALCSHIKDIKDNTLITLCSYIGKVNQCIIVIDDYFECLQIIIINMLSFYNELVRYITNLSGGKMHKMSNILNNKNYYRRKYFKYKIKYLKIKNLNG